MKISGKAICYGANVDTDVIIPARYLNTTDKKALAAHCMEDIDKDFHKKVQNGATIIVAGANFGCGSSREHAPIAIKESGVALVLAPGFARIFYRNAINIGLPILELPALCEETLAGDLITADLATGIIENARTQKTYQAVPFPAFIRDLIAEGGLVPFAKASGFGKDINT